MLRNTLVLSINAVTFRRELTIVNRVAIFILLYSVIIGHENFFITYLDNGIGISNGLFHSTAITKNIDLCSYAIFPIMFLIIAFIVRCIVQPIIPYNRFENTERQNELFSAEGLGCAIGLFYLLCLDDFSAPSGSIVSHYDNFVSLIALKVYSGADSSIKLALKENKDRSGIYRLTNNITGATYVGSSVNLARRLRQYYSPGFLKKEILKNNSIVYKALLKYGYFNFKLEILEYCSREDLIEREQYYLDMLEPTYNICKLAGSSLGRETSDFTRRKLKAARLLREYDRQKLQGETFFEYKVRKIEEGISELESNITRLRGTLEKLQLGKLKSKVSEATRQKILASTKTAQAVEVTDLVTGTINRYPSARSAALALNASNSTIMNKLNNKNSKVFRGRYEIKSLPIGEPSE